MNNFLKYFQPTIVKASYDESLPENIQGKFFINLNILGNCINENTPLDIPRIFIVINDKLINDNTNVVQNLISYALINPVILRTGVDSFICGEDYYLNDALYNFINAIEEVDPGVKLPNYLDENAQITQYWIDFSNESYGNYTDIEYFNKQNKILEQHFSEDELNNFYANFCKLILDNTNIDAETKNSGNNPIYTVVLNYFSHFKNDDGSVALQLI